MIAQYGPDAVAGYGAAARIESVVMVVFLAISSIIGPFVGQNLGADKPDRIREAMRLCGIFCLLFGLVLSIGLSILAPYIITLFSDAPAVVAVGTQYIYTVSLGFGAAGIVMVVNAAFNGLGRPLPAVIISTTRIFLLMVPIAWLGDMMLGLNGVFFGVLIANLVAASAGYYWLHRRCFPGFEVSRSQ